MPESPVLQRVLIVRDPSLPFLDLDLAEGDAAGTRELCLLGPNGIGKSALLARLHELLSGFALGPESDEGYALAKFALSDETLYLARRFGSEERLLLRPSIETTASWKTLAADPPAFSDLARVFANHLADNATGLARCPSLWFDSARCLVDGVATESLEDFLSTRLSGREEAFGRFLRSPENRDKTVAEVERDFDAHSPHALPLLREVWTRLLRPAGLSVDFAHGDGPFFDGTGATVPTSRLGHALRRLLLQTGLAFARVPGNEDAPTAIFLDGPEEGLHPDLALGLVPLLRTLPGRTPPRFFIATHSPLVASRFAPECRLLLSVDPTGTIAAARGIASENADADAILRSDFAVAEPRPPGVVAPEPRRPNLKRAIRDSEDEDELADLIDEAISFPKS